MRLWGWTFAAALLTASAARPCEPRPPEPWSKEIGGVAMRQLCKPDCSAPTLKISARRGEWAVPAFAWPGGLLTGREGDLLVHLDLEGTVSIFHRDGRSFSVRLATYFTAEELREGFAPCGGPNLRPLKMSGDKIVATLSPLRPQRADVRVEIDLDTGKATRVGEPAAGPEAPLPTLKPAPELERGAPPKRGFGPPAFVVPGDAGALPSYGEKGSCHCASSALLVPLVAIAALMRRRRHSALREAGESTRRSRE